MKRVKIEKLNIVMPKDEKKDVIYVNVRNIEDALIFDFIAKGMLQIRYCITDKEYAAFIPEESKLIGKRYDYYHNVRTIKQGWCGATPDSLELDSNIAELIGVSSWNLPIELYDSCIIVGKNQNIFSYMRDRTNTIQGKRLQAKYEREKNKMLKDFKSLKTIPYHFKKKAEKIASTHIMYLKPFYGNKTTTGVCSCCKKEVTFEKGTVRIGDKSVCPICGSAVLIKPYSSMDRKQIFENIVYLHLFQKTKDGRFVIRDFDCRGQVKGLEETSFFTEIGRQFYNEGNRTQMYYNKYNPWTGENFWDNTGFNIFEAKYPNDAEGYSYGELEDFNGEDISYIRGKQCMPLRTTRFCKNDLSKQILVKNGFANLACTSMKFDGFYLEDILDLKTSTIKRIKKQNPSPLDYAWIKYAEDNRIKDEGEITWFNKKGLYPEYLSKAIERLGIKQTKNLISLVKPKNLAQFAMALSNNPTIEYLVKAGMPKLAVECTEKNIAVSAGIGPMALGINREEWNRLKKYKGNVAALRWLQYENESGVRVKDEALKWFIKENVEPATSILKYTTPVKAMNYVIRQTDAIKADDTFGYETYSSIWNTWRDYLQMGEKIMMNFEEEVLLKPKNVKIAHDLLANEKRAAIKEAEILEKWPDVNNILHEIKDKYSYSDKEYAIVVPNSIQDIIAEGTALGHCLDREDSYYESIHNRNSFIFFLRRKDENKSFNTPWYTLEVEPNGSCRQKRTTGDRQNDDYESAIKFIKKWQRQLRRKLNTNDLALQQLSNAQREAKYAKYEAEKAAVWHGPFAGQSLAKLLRDDYLPAIDDVAA